MTKAQTTMEEAFRLLSAIPVRGDDVEIMARAKALLRTAYKQAGEKEAGADG